jgi:hypothetical protein
MADNEEFSSRTKLPTEVDGEDPMLMVGEFRLSLRQMLTIAIAFGAWFAILNMTTTIIPISTIFAGLLWSWVLLFGIFLALKKKDGRPYEEYLSEKIQFLISDREYILKDSRAGKSDVDWDQPLSEEESQAFYYQGEKDE